MTIAAADADTVIVTDALSCRFGPTLAVDRLSLTVRAGEVFGLLGHNGAGKTTTIRLLNGIVAPSGGRASVFGLSPTTDGQHIRRLTGVLTETPALDERLTARENLVFFGRLYGLSAAAAAQRTAALLSEFELATRADERTGGYSKGMKQRLALARLLLHEPRLLFLDEPTAGLDPAASRHLHELILQLAEHRDRTVVLCTHNLFEAERLCDRVAVLAAGRVLAIDTPAALARRFAPPGAVEIEVAAADAPVAARVATDAVSGATVETVEGGVLTVRGVDRDAVPRLVAALAAAGARIHRVAPSVASLGDAYFALQRTIPTEDAA
jgi:ABC-2 type transport system ATP-binding protein